MDNAKRLIQVGEMERTIARYDELVEDLGRRIRFAIPPAHTEVIYTTAQRCAEAVAALREWRTIHEETGLYDDLTDQCRDVQYEIDKFLTALDNVDFGNVVEEIGSLHDDTVLAYEDLARRRAEVESLRKQAAEMRRQVEAEHKWTGKS